MTEIPSDAPSGFRRKSMRSAIPVDGIADAANATLGLRDETTEEQEYEKRLRNLVRVVSACTLGPWSFAAGLLIATFYLL